MNRIEFIGELKKRLRKLPYDEIKEAVDYYEEYFNEAGEENEQAVLTELGTPAALAAQIIAEFAIKDAGTEKSVKKSWRSAWLVVLALFALPIAVPLAVAVGAVVLALVISISAVFISLFASGIGLIAVSLLYIVAGILLIVQSPATTVLMLGLGLFSLGTGMAIFFGSAALSKKFFGWLAKQVSGFILRRNAQ